jgi:hypothetical protein
MELTRDGINNGINKTPMLKVIPPQSWKHKPLKKIPLD